MAANKAKAAKVGLCDILECPICLEPFKKPKALPCLHTFCLECLEKYGEDEIPGKKLSCPFCKQAFPIPQGGFQTFPSNFFIEKILEERQTTGSRAAQVQEVECEMCNEDNKPGKTLVSKYCVDCGQNACDSCVGTHRNIHATRNHNVVPVKDRNKYQTLMKSRPTYCDEHKDKPLELYCYDCKTPICLMCSVLKHMPKSHHCEDIQKTSQKFSLQLQACFPQLKNCTDIVQEAVNRQTDVKGELMKKVSESEKTINCISKDLHRII
jgi:hypothetical protein